MKSLYPLFALIPLSFTLSTVAQDPVSTAELNAAVETQRQITEAQRQQIVMQNVQLTGPESEEFWPAYREYRADVAKVNDRLVALIASFGRNFETLGDKESMAMLKEAMDIEQDKLKLSKKYSRTLNKFLSGEKVLRLMQIESRLDAMIDLKIKNSIPLAETPIRIQPENN